MGAKSSSHSFEHQDDRVEPSSAQRRQQTRPRFLPLSYATTKPFHKFSFKRKRSSRDKVKPFKEMLDGWTFEELNKLIAEFKTLQSLRMLRDDADSARPSTSTLGEQLLEHASNYGNLTITFKRTNFEVKAIRCYISNRSDVIARLAAEPTSELIELQPPEGTSHEQIKTFFDFLYTDIWSGDQSIKEKLSQWLGCSRSRKRDLMRIKTKGATEGDIRLCIARNGQNVEEAHSSIRCHSSILSARSPFLHSLLSKGQDDRLVLDESLLPAAFLSALVHFLYTDELDLGLIEDYEPSQSSLSQAKAIVSGKYPEGILLGTTHFYHIAKFFQLDKLAQLCEDTILASLNADSCVMILNWAIEGGNQFVYAKAQRFLEEEFSRIATSHQLFDIPFESMKAATKSLFIQATEVEILECAIRWGEHEMIKRMEEREPNVVCETAHSISRRGVKRADLDGAELKEILAPLTENIRTQYVLPPFHQTLNSAYKRGILERVSALCDPQNERDARKKSPVEIHPDIDWFEPGQTVPGPRCFTPYYETALSKLDELLHKEPRNSLAQLQAKSDNEFPLKLRITNNMKLLLSNEIFDEVSDKIRESLAREDATYGIRSFPRYFHRQAAVKYVSLLMKCNFMRLFFRLLNESYARTTLVQSVFVLNF
ncbi:hypothetical protein WR25_20648 isoform C [Diploscapter pachys]|uniref:BTB domain-containing protein n=1 Tax=Diploscapter pachys TaxID=2018661 RepID=A0A2A2L2S5_9BILA|nr:hypothetical protein WR25_20648 isoform C [Diploscapter pachys]